VNSPLLCSPAEEKKERRKKVTSVPANNRKMAAPMMAAAKKGGKKKRPYLEEGEAFEAEQGAPKNLGVAGWSLDRVLAIESEGRERRRRGALSLFAAN